MKYFPNKLLDYEIFKSMVSWATNFFFEKFVKPSDSPPIYLMYAPLLFAQKNLHDNYFTKSS